MKLFYTPPDWLRWILLLPVSLCVGVLVIGVINLLIPSPPMFREDTLPIWICLFLSGTLSQYLTCWTAYTCAPKGKTAVLRVVSIISILILSLIFIDHITTAYRYRSSEFSRIVQVETIGAIVGSLYALFTIRPPSTQ